MATVLEIEKIREKLETLYKKWMKDIAEEIKVEKEANEGDVIFRVRLKINKDSIDVPEKYEKFIEKIEEMKENEELEIDATAIVESTADIDPMYLSVTQYWEDTIKEIIIEFTVYGESLGKFEKVLDEFLLSLI